MKKNNMKTFLLIALLGLSQFGFANRLEGDFPNDSTIQLELNEQDSVLQSHIDEAKELEETLASVSEQVKTKFLLGKNKIQIELYSKNDDFYSDSSQTIEWGKFPKVLFLENGNDIIIDIPVSEMEMDELPDYSVLYLNQDSVVIPYTGLIKLSNLPVKKEINIGIKQFNKKGKEIPFGKSENLSGSFKVMEYEPYFTNDAVVFGVLMLILAAIFYTSGLNAFKGFYKYVPALLLCYFIPAIFNSLNIISKDISGVYSIAKLYLLPASIVLLCMSIDLKAISRLGNKALIMFFSSTIGIIIGGPLALWLVGSMNPDLFNVQEGEEFWRGFSTVAGSWIGGGANQTAMKEIADTSDTMFGNMIIVDVVVANLFMSVLLLGIGYRDRINKFFKADNSSILALEKKMENFQSSIAKIPTLRDIMVLLGVTFTIVALAHVCSDYISPLLTDWYDAKIKANPDSWIKYLSSITGGFFWLVILATIGGVALSFTKFKKYEGVGASKFGSLFLYILVATIGMKMDIAEMIANWSDFSVIVSVGLLWMLFHVIILFVVAKIIKAPFFFLAVGSQANVGGAASAPVVAGAFNPALAPVGVLLAVLGYVVGTVGALLCMSMMAGVG